MEIYRIMIANAFVLIILGVFGYISSGSPTALIAPAIGVIFLILSFSVKKNNKTAAHIAVILTLISAVIFFITAITRNNMIVMVMAVFTLIALILYVMDFMKRKKQRDQQN